MPYAYRVCASLLSLLLVLSACAPAAAIPVTAQETPTQAAGASNAELGELKTYVVTQADALHTSIVELQAASSRYYELAKATNFDYHALWASQPAQVLAALKDARAAFLAANPQYERMEGVVAGVPGLSQYDLILDAGAAGASGAEDVAPFDLTLPDGRLLARPGNLFEVTEATLWGTDPAYRIEGVQPDFNGNGQVDLGDALSDANVLKGTADAFEKYSGELRSAAQAWQPNEVEAFGALLANIPTFSDFMESWKNSRFVMGSASTERGFVATSRLADLSDNILSWQKIYAGLSPAVKAGWPEQDAQITRDLQNLQEYVSDLYDQETNQGKRFSPEEADLLNSEGQKRAAAIAGQIAQAAAQLGISVEVE
jgi:hypothetical protein